MQQKSDPVKLHSDQKQSATDIRFTAPKPSSLPSCGELERSTGQAIQKAYRQHLGHLPTHVSCHLFANRLSIWIENSLTPVENILFSSEPSPQPSKAQPASDSPDPKYAQAVRFAIDQALERRLGQVIEGCLDVNVLTLIAGTSYEQKCTSLTALLSETPTVRNPERIPKTIASREANRKALVKK